MLAAHVTRKRRQKNRADEPLTWIAPGQYRETFGREPDLPQLKAELWPHEPAWPKWNMPWRPPTVIVVMAEWTDVFLWNRSPVRDPFAGDYVLDPDVLGVSSSLTERLRAWNDRYGGQASESREGTFVTWNREGLALAQELQREFDAREVSVQIVYHDNLDQKERPVRDVPPG